MAGSPTGTVPLDRLLASLTVHQDAELLHQHFDPVGYITEACASNVARSRYGHALAQSCSVDSDAAIHSYIRGIIRRPNPAEWKPASLTVGMMQFQSMQDPLAAPVVYRCRAVSEPLPEIAFLLQQQQPMGSPRNPSPVPRPQTPASAVTRPEHSGVAPLTPDPGGSSGVAFAPRLSADRQTPDNRPPKRCRSVSSPSPSTALHLAAAAYARCSSAAVNTRGALLPAAVGPSAGRGRTVTVAPPATPAGTTEFEAFRPLFAGNSAVAFDALFSFVASRQDGPVSETLLSDVREDMLDFFCGVKLVPKQKTVMIDLYTFRVFEKMFGAKGHSKIFDMVTEVYSLSCFHGFMARSSSRSLLELHASNSKRRGQALLRFSESELRNGRLTMDALRVGEAELFSAFVTYRHDLHGWMVGSDPQPGDPCFARLVDVFHDPRQAASIPLPIPFKRIGPQEIDYDEGEFVLLGLPDSVTAEDISSAVQNQLDVALPPDAVRLFPGDSAALPRAVFSSPGLCRTRLNGSDRCRVLLRHNSCELHFAPRYRELYELYQARHFEVRGIADSLGPTRWLPVPQQERHLGCYPFDVVLDGPQISFAQLSQQLEVEEGNFVLYSTDRRWHIRLQARCHPTTGTMNPVRVSPGPLGDTRVQLLQEQPLQIRLCLSVLLAAAECPMRIEVGLVDDGPGASNVAVEPYSTQISEPFLAMTGQMFKLGSPALNSPGQFQPGSAAPASSLEDAQNAPSQAATPESSGSSRARDIDEFLGLWRASQDLLSPETLLDYLALRQQAGPGFPSRQDVSEYVYNFLENAKSGARVGALVNREAAVLFANVFFAKGVARVFHMVREVYSIRYFHRFLDRDAARGILDRELKQAGGQRGQFLLRFSSKSIDTGCLVLDALRADEQTEFSALVRYSPPAGGWIIGKGKDAQGRPKAYEQLKHIYETNMTVLRSPVPVDKNPRSRQPVSHVFPVKDIAELDGKNVSADNPEVFAAAPPQPAAVPAAPSSRPQQADAHPRCRG